VDLFIPIALLTVSVLIVFFAIVFGVVFLFLRPMASRNIAAALERHPSAQVLERAAMFFGQESKGVTQLRGTGTLLLTEHEVYFRKWVPMTEYVIPLGSITSIETPNVHLGKTYGKPLLKVSYQREDGQPDSIAWSVRDLDAAIAQVEAMRARPKMG
jgi:predicted secreted protein